MNRADDLKNFSKVIVQSNREDEKENLVKIINERSTLYHLCAEFISSSSFFIKVVEELNLMDYNKIDSNQVFFELKNEEKMSVLEILLRNERFEILKSLINKNYISPQYQTKEEGNYLIFLAAKYSSYDHSILEFLFLMNDKTDLISLKNKSNQNILHFLCDKKINIFSTTVLSYIFEILNKEYQQQNHHLLQLKSQYQHLLQTKQHPNLLYLLPPKPSQIVSPFFFLFQN